MGGGLSLSFFVDSVQENMMEQTEFLKAHAEQVKKPSRKG
jgi:hypothetical protein